MKFDWMDKLFACLLFISLVGNAANFHYNNAWIHGFNALPALALVTIVHFRVHGLDGLKSKKYMNRVGMYLFPLFVVQFGLEFLRQYLAGASKFENYSHVAIVAMFILVFIITFHFKSRNSSPGKQQLPDSYDEAQKDGNN